MVINGTGFLHLYRNWDEFGYYFKSDPDNYGNVKVPLAPGVIPMKGGIGWQEEPSNQHCFRGTIKRLAVYDYALNPSQPVAVPRNTWLQRKCCVAQLWPRFLTVAESFAK